MSIADSILVEIEKSKKNEVAEVIEKMRGAKTLNKTDFKELVSVLQRKAIEVLSQKNLTMGMYHLIGKALMASKLRNTQETVEFIVQQNNKHTAELMHCMLNKSCKIDTTPVEFYLDRMLAGEVHLIHLKVLQVVAKNYPQLLNKKIFGFCEERKHPICEEILKKHKIHIEE